MFNINNSHLALLCFVIVFPICLAANEPIKPVDYYTELDIYYGKTFFGIYPHKYTFVDVNTDRRMTVEFASQGQIRYSEYDLGRMKTIVEYYSLQNCPGNSSLFVVDSLIQTNRDWYEKELLQNSRSAYLDYKYDIYKFSKGDTLRFVDQNYSLIAKSVTYQLDELSGSYGCWARPGHKMRPIMSHDDLIKIMEFLNESGNEGQGFNLTHIQFFFGFCDEKYLK